MSGTDERLKCWAAGVIVANELEAARENARRMLDLLQEGKDPYTNVSFDINAKNFRLHMNAAQKGVEEAEACGGTPEGLNWVRELARTGVATASLPTDKDAAKSRFEDMDSVIDWLRRDAAGIGEPLESEEPEDIKRGDMFPTSVTSH